MAVTWTTHIYTTPRNGCKHYMLYMSMDVWGREGDKMACSCSSFNIVCVGDCT